MDLSRRFFSEDDQRANNCLALWQNLVENMFHNKNKATKLLDLLSIMQLIKEKNTQ